MLIKKIVKRISFFIVLCVLVFFITQRGCTSQNDALPQPTEIGRDFRSLSLHPKSKEILFIECDKSLATRCGVFRYHLETKHLQRYALPQGYVYQSANFSPQGTYIVINRIPLWMESEERIRSAYEHAEIMVMKTDGSDLRILPLTRGPKTGPIMSNSEDKIAYWRYKLRKPGSKTLGASFDLWEVDLKKGEDQLFAGSFQFFEVSQMQYMLTGNEILLGAYGPSTDGKSKVDIWNYSDKYKNSAIYQLTRGQRILSDPLFSAKMMGAKMPTMDSIGNIYYEAGLPGLYLFKSKNIVSESSQQWLEVEKFLYMSSLTASPQGDFLMFIYDLSGTDYKKQELLRSIGCLDTLTGKWQDIPIPKFDEAHLVAMQIIK